MKKLKNRFAVLTAVVILGSTSVIFASSVKTPDADLKTFHSQMLEQRQDILDQRVKDGDITQEEADIIYNRMKNNHETGNARRGMRHGTGMGRGMGYGMGAGYGCGFR